MLFRKFKTFISTLVFLFTTSALAINANEQDQQANKTTSTLQEITRSTKYNVPFLLLMSKDEISVSQIPLISSSINVIYRLTDSVDPNFNSTSEQETEKEENSDFEDGGDDDDGTTKVVIADASRYERQMPQSAILGKFEWQQQQTASSIAPSSDDKFMSVQEEEVSTSKAVGTQEGSNQEVKRPRRRSNNLTDNHGNRRSTRSNSISSSDSNNGFSMDSNNNGSSANVNAVMKSSSLNVTSAQFSTRSKEEGNVVAPEGGVDDVVENDKNGPSFSDFDIHMALGYAFVSDTTGRIHRFRLSDFEAGANLESSENDYSNTIDAAASKAAASEGNLFSRIQSMGKSFTSMNNIRNDAVSSNQRGAHHDDGGDAISGDDANKVNSVVEVAAATERQFGRHPSASGLRATSSGVFVENIMVDSSNRSGTPISDNLNSGNNYFTSRNNKKISNKLHRLDDSKSRIIWSRAKHGFPTVAHPAKQQASTQKGAQSVVGGAFPQQNGELVATGSSSSNNNDDDDNQITNEAEQHMGGAEDEPQPADYHRDEQEAFTSMSGQTSADSSAAATNKLQQQRKVNRKLRTEIAVDWLNNLLFVLDKYRLLVVDFDGNNELVLIDDFNVNNRPIEIKVDPINCFLFWLQAGNFSNTIYKLDLGILSKDRIGNTLKLTNQGSRVGNVDYTGHSSDTSNLEFAALISHHYAHPIITNLTKDVKQFIIDYKHSRIYVPLAATTNESSADRNKTQRDDAEVFKPPSPDSKEITHMDSTSNGFIDSSIYPNEVDKNSDSTGSSSAGQILAYNLDGTDVGPLRGADERSHLSEMEDMRDITFDSEKGFFYWITKDGNSIVGEYKDGNDSTFQLHQHLEHNKAFKMVKHFDAGSNQPVSLRQRLVLVLPASTNRRVRSDKDRIEDNGVASSLDGRHHPGGIDTDVTRFSRNAPFIILGITCLVVLSVYLIYAFVFQKMGFSSASTNASVVSRDGSIVGSSIEERSHKVDCAVNQNGLLGANSISRWMPSTSSPRSTDNSTFNCDYDLDNERLDSCDFRTNSYNASNAIDEHYREVFSNQTLCGALNGEMADLGEWPANMHDLSNKLYVPVEVLHDEALSSIQRVSIDQLDIENRNVLGEGHFGKVLQGTITCKINEKNALIFKDRYDAQRDSYASSVTDDYLTPKSHCTSSVVSEHKNDNATPSATESCYSYGTQAEKSSDLTIETKFKVAIKKLKNNASANEKRDFLHEAKLLAKFNHPNIVHLMGICLDRGSTLIVMELMLGGDLIRYMQETQNPNFEDSLTLYDQLAICLDIVNGCCYLEERKHIHRDLAARNCLVSSRKREERVVKLADFGLARDIYKYSYYKKIGDTAMPLKWMAPECFEEQKFTTKSDVWSFGIVMWEVMSCCKEKPYEDVPAHFIKSYLVDGKKRLDKPLDCRDDIYDLMRSCWQIEPEFRPTFSDCRTRLIEILETI